MELHLYSEAQHLNIYMKIHTLIQNSVADLAAKGGCATLFYSLLKPSSLFNTTKIPSTLFIFKLYIIANTNQIMMIRVYFST